MRIMTALSFIFFMLISSSLLVYAESFVSLCESPKKMEEVTVHHTKVYFPDFAENQTAISNLKIGIKKYAKGLCSNVGKRAYHGKWHPKPFDFGEIIGVTYFKKGENLGYPDRFARADDFYYIVHAYGGLVVSQCSRVDPR